MNLSQALEIASCTDPGIVRSHNEDSIAADASKGLVVLADGMGGYNAGEVASGMATTVITTELQHLLEDTPPYKIEPATGKPFADRLLREQIAKANTSIFQAAQSQPQYSGMGTTLVTAMFYDNKVTLAHIGDSRAYRLRGEAFEQLTRDHSLLQEQIDSGMITPEQAKFSQNKNLVTRALGIDPTVEPEIQVYPTRTGDVYLLCSARGAAVGPDGERQRRAGQRVGDPRPGGAGLRCAARLGRAVLQLVEMSREMLFQMGIWPCLQS